MLVFCRLFDIRKVDLVSLPLVSSMRQYWPIKIVFGRNLSILHPSDSHCSCPGFVTSQSNQFFLPKQISWFTLVDHKDRRPESLNKEYVFLTTLSKSGKPNIKIRIDGPLGSIWRVLFLSGFSLIAFSVFSLAESSETKQATPFFFKGTTSSCDPQTPDPSPHRILTYKYWSNTNIHSASKV